MAEELPDKAAVASTELTEDPVTGPAGAAADASESDVKAAAEQPKLSKRQQKKQLKTQYWLNHKHEKRQHERVKKKERKKAAKERGEDLGPSRKRLKQNRMEDSACKVKVVVDCSFDDLMTDREICSLVSQVNFCYAANRRSKNPLQYYVTSANGKTETRLHQMPDHQNWDVYFKKEHFADLFDKKSIVYLSSDSDNILETLDEDKVYVIGGLVDHNAHKGHCHALAEEKGYTHAQLPIGKYVELRSRKVLAVNHVFEILLNYTETLDWEEAFYGVIPKRKVNYAGSQAPAGQKNEESNPGDATSSSASDTTTEVSRTTTEVSQTTTEVSQNTTEVSHSPIKTNMDLKKEESGLSLSVVNLEAVDAALKENNLLNEKNCISNL